MTNIAYYRKLRGLSQEDLAQKIGVKQPHISRIENGDDGPPLRLFMDIADALDVSLADLFSEEMTKAALMVVDAFRSGSDETRRLMSAMAKEVESLPLGDNREKPEI
ncbi:helix-turn-helix domain-containing protein [Pacificibacter marinus]|uniref:Anaerobic benzoate catabolism transcriptional regulator n=1 Tax=Pacificibacter marinus TaxID=658057 RepID=A0A1Y5TJK3_9RHOB|nr:helix-turn-helix transcriptional regulator [Pacificibacter marinus]SEL23968.1 DNA-binding transcriptional regulator, XRE-family HTH domain [Pacificibacter marinus]SLN65615.1 anaerobic benzoate catabolism transcriptional regulator [Pacificibacter marinus]